MLSKLPARFLGFLRIVQSSSRSVAQLQFSTADVKIGDSVVESRSFSQKEVNEFAILSGDCNPMHVDPEFVKKAGYYEGTIVHGAFVNAFVSCILGMKMPGPGTVSVTQEMRFPNPLYVDETVQGRATVVDIKKRFITCEVTCSVADKVVYAGKAVVWLKKLD